MTREEAWRSAKGYLYDALSGEEADEIIKALEIEPCDDAISRQTVLDGVASIAKAKARSDAQKALMGRVMFFTEHLSSVNPQEPRWIPVSERLPEKDMPCLVSVGIFHITKIAVYSDLLKTIEHKIFYTGDYGHADFADITEYVLAWMPLPEPYKADKEIKHNG